MDKKTSSRLILVSNRLPLKATKQDGKTIFTESDGGLVSALKSYFEKNNDGRFAERFWVGAADSRAPLLDANLQPQKLTDQLGWHDVYMRVFLSDFANRGGAAEVRADLSDC